jgi:hypothetical protein
LEERRAEAEQEQRGEDDENQTLSLHFNSNAVRSNRTAEQVKAR